MMLRMSSTFCSRPSMAELNPFDALAAYRREATGSFGMWLDGAAEVLGRLASKFAEKAADEPIQHRTDATWFTRRAIRVTNELVTFGLHFSNPAVS
jgi:hypothetical protein